MKIKKRASKLKKHNRHFFRFHMLISAYKYLLVLFTVFLVISVYLATSSGIGPFSTFLIPPSINVTISESQCGDRVGYHWDDALGCIHNSVNTVKPTVVIPTPPKPDTPQSTSPGKSCAGVSAGVQIPSGSWAATGRNMGIGRESERECVQCVNGVWKNSATAACHVKYVEDPSHIILPPNPGSEYTVGLTAAEIKSKGITITPQPTENCYLGGLIMPTGTQSGVNRCFNGKWVSEADYKTLMSATCGVKKYNETTHFCETVATIPSPSILIPSPSSFTPIPSPTASTFNTISDCAKDLSPDQVCVLIVGGHESGSYKRAPKQTTLAPSSVAASPCGPGFILRDGYCDDLFAGDRSDAMHAADVAKCRANGLPYDTNTGLCQAQTSGRPHQCDQGQNGTTYIECKPAVAGQGGASVIYHFCSATPNGKPQEYVVGVGCMDVAGTAVNTAGVFTGGETTTNVNNCKYGGTSNISGYTCKYSNGTTTKPAMPTATKLPLASTIPTSPVNGTLASGSICKSGQDGACVSGKCSEGVRPSDGRKDYYCMSTTNLNLTSTVVNGKTLKADNSLCFGDNSNCVSGFCQINHGLFGWLDRCADNPFVVASTTKITVPPLLAPLKTSPFAMTGLSSIGNKSAAPVSPETSLPKITNEEFDKLLGKQCVVQDSKVYLIDNLRCGIKCEGIPPKTVENCYEVVPPLPNETYCNNSNVTDKFGKIMSSCDSGCQDGICIQNTQNTACSSIGEVRPAGNNSYLYCDSTTRQWKPFAGSRQFVFTDFCPNSYRTAYLKDAVPIQAALAANNPLYLDCGGTGSQGGETQTDRVTLFCDPITYANDPGACPSTIIHEFMHVWALDQSNGTTDFVAGFDNAIGCRDLGNNLYSYSTETVVDDAKYGHVSSVNNGVSISDTNCAEAFALSNNHYVNNSCYEKTNYPVQYNWLKNNIYNGVEFCGNSTSQSNTQQQNNKLTIPKIDYLSQLNYSGERVAGGVTWADVGCGVMTGAMVFSLKNGVADPYAYNLLLNQHGGVTSAGTGWFDQNKPILEENGFNVVPVYGSIDEKRTQITEYAKNGIPVWIVAYVDNGSGTYVGHNTLAVGVDPSTGDLILDDPYYGENYHMPITRFDMDCSKSGTRNKDGTYQCPNGTGSWIMNAVIPPTN